MKEDDKTQPDLHKHLIFVMKKEIQLNLDLNSSFTIKQISAHSQQRSHGGEKNSHIGYSCM
jgi:hypothetical protein